MASNLIFEMIENYNLKETLLIGYFDKNGSSCRAVRGAALPNATFNEILFPQDCYDNYEDIPKIKDVKAFELANSDEISILSINVEIQNKWAHIFVNHLYNIIKSSSVKRIVILSSIFPVDIPKDLSKSSFFETSLNAEYLTEFGRDVNLKLSGIFLNYLIQVAILKRLSLNILWVIGNKCKQGFPNIHDQSLENIEIFQSMLRKFLSQDFDINISKHLELNWDEDNLIYR